MAGAGRGGAGGLCLGADKGGADFAGRSYAAYGGVYVCASLVWLWLAEGQRPDRWDLTGGVIVLVGAAVILLAPRGA